MYVRLNFFVGNNFKVSTGTFALCLWQLLSFWQLRIVRSHANTYVFMFVCLYVYMFYIVSIFALQHSFCNGHKSHRVAIMALSLFSQMAKCVCVCVCKCANNGLWKPMFVCVFVRILIKTIKGFNLYLKCISSSLCSYYSAFLKTIWSTTTTKSVSVCLFEYWRNCFARLLQLKCGKSKPLHEKWNRGIRAEKS